MMLQQNADPEVSSWTPSSMTRRVLEELLLPEMMPTPGIVVLVMVPKEQPRQLQLWHIQQEDFVVVLMPLPY